MEPPRDSDQKRCPAVGLGTPRISRAEFYSIIQSNTFANRHRAANGTRRKASRIVPAFNSNDALSLRGPDRLKTFPGYGTFVKRFRTLADMRDKPRIQQIQRDLVRDATHCKMMATVDSLAQGVNGYP